MKGNELLKYRNAWLGCAMIWIVWYHTNIDPSLRVLSWIKSIGYGGVDICLFASGVGCFVSLSRDPDSFNFMKRRFARLMPTYLCFILLWVVYKMVIDPLPAQAILGNILGIQYFTGLGNDFNWYISAILLLYLLAPLLKDAAQKAQRLSQQILAVLLLAVISIPFWGAYQFIIIVSRIPVFYVGMLFAKLCLSGRPFTGKMAGLFAAGSVAGVILLGLFFTKCSGLLWSWGLYWYPFILICPGVCVGISCLMRLLDKQKWSRIFVWLLDKAGQYSFEIYLVHVIIFEILRYMIYSLGLFSDTPLVWAAAIGCTIVCSVALRFVVSFLQKVLRQLRSRVLEK